MGRAPCPRAVMACAPLCACVVSTMNFVRQEGIAYPFDFLTLVRSELDHAPIARRIFAGVSEIKQLVPIADCEGDESFTACFIMVA